MCLMNRDGKYKENFNSEIDNDFMPIVVLGANTTYFPDGIIDIGKIVYNDIST